MMKRILVLLAVGAIMVVALVGGVASAAFGRPTITSGCIVHAHLPGFFLVTNAGEIPSLAKYDRNGDDTVCGYTNGFNELHFTDNNHKS
jgi:hypothetical protein